MEAGTLELKFSSDLAQLTLDMNKAKDIVGSSMKNISSSIGLVKSALGVLGVGLSVGYFKNLILSTSEAAEHLHNLGVSTGISVKELSGLKLLAEQSGTSIDGLANSFSRMSVNIGKNPEKFKAIGITAKDGVGQLKQFADVFASLTDISQRNALAQAVFSRSWREIAPALAEGGQAIANTIARGEQLSGMNEELANSARKFNDQLVELNTTVDHFKNKMLGDMLPTLNDAAKAMLSFAERGEAFKSVMVGIWTLGLGSFGDTPLAKAATQVKDLQAAVDQLQAQSDHPTLWSRTKIMFGVDIDKELADAKEKLKAAKSQLQTEMNNIAPAVATSSKTSAIEGINNKVAELLGEAYAKTYIDSLKNQLLRLNEGPWEAMRQDNIKRAKDAQLSPARGNALISEIQLTTETKMVQQFTDALNDASDAYAFHTSLINMGADAQAAAVIVEQNYLQAMQRIRAAQNSGPLLPDTINKIWEASNKATQEQLNMLAWRKTEQEVKDVYDLHNALAQTVIDYRSQTEQIGMGGNELEKYNITQRNVLDVEKKIRDARLAGREYSPQAQANLRAETDKANNELIAAINDRIKAESSWHNGAVAGLQDYAAQAANVAQNVSNAYVSAFKSMADALTNFVMNGQLDFKQLANSIIADLVRVRIEASITGPFSSWLGSLGGGGASTATADEMFGTQIKLGANGALFSGAGISRYSGSVVDSPTLFPFARGVGLMGEAGAEAVLPLSRSRDGKLGVEAQSGTSINYAPVFNIDSRSDREQIMADVTRVTKQSQADLVNRLERQRRI